MIFEAIYKILILIFLVEIWTCCSSRRISPHETCTDDATNSHRMAKQTLNKSVKRTLVFAGIWASALAFVWTMSVFLLFVWFNSFTLVGWSAHPFYS